MYMQTLILSLTIQGSHVQKEGSLSKSPLADSESFSITLCGQSDLMKNLIEQLVGRAASNYWLKGVWLPNQRNIKLTFAKVKVHTSSRTMSNFLKLWTQTFGGKYFTRKIINQSASHPAKYSKIIFLYFRWRKITCSGIFSDVKKLVPTK